MGTDQDVWNAGLVLGLGCHGEVENRFKLKNPQQESTLLCFEFDQGSSSKEGLDTSLNLGFTSVKINKIKEYEQVQEVRQSSPQSTVTSFSNLNQEIKRIKRERDGGSEDVELERLLSSRGSDEDDEGSSRKKLRLTKEQSALLENNFKEHCTLNPKQKQALAEQLNLRPRQVEVWFQNRRARTKLKQTEVDCEHLKRWCETLKQENRRLQRELHELKTIKFASPVYMPVPVPPATLTMCPSCERMGGGSNTSSHGPFALAPRSSQHLYDPFSHHRSTPC